MRCNSAAHSLTTRLWVAAVCIVVQVLVAAHGARLSGEAASSLATATSTVDRERQSAAGARQHTVLFSDTIPRLSVGIYNLDLNTNLESDKFLDKFTRQINAAVEFWRDRLVERFGDNALDPFGCGDTRDMDLSTVTDEANADGGGSVVCIGNVTAMLSLAASAPVEPTCEGITNATTELIVAQGVDFIIGPYGSDLVRCAAIEVERLWGNSSVTMFSGNGAADSLQWCDEEEMENLNNTLMCGGARGPMECFLDEPHYRRFEHTILLQLPASMYFKGIAPLTQQYNVRSVTVLRRGNSTFSDACAKGLQDMQDTNELDISREIYVTGHSDAEWRRVIDQLASASAAGTDGESMLVGCIETSDCIPLIEGLDKASDRVFFEAIFLTVCVGEPTFEEYFASIGRSTALYGLSGAVTWDYRSRGNEFRECSSQTHAHLFTDADKSEFSPELFYDAFNAEFEDLRPLGPQGAASMVAVYALHSAIARANTTDRQAVGEAANKLSEFSSFAGKIRLDDYGRSSERQALLVQYTKDSAGNITTSVTYPPAARDARLVFPMPDAVQKVARAPTPLTQPAEKTVLYMVIGFCAVHALLAIFVLKHREHPNVKRSSSPWLLLAFLLGCSVVVCSILAFPVNELRATCGSRAWALMLPLVVCLVPTVRVFLKKIDKHYQNPVDAKRGFLTRVLLSGSWSVLFICYVLVYGSYWTFSLPFQYDELTSDLQKHTNSNLFPGDNVPVCLWEPEFLTLLWVALVVGLVFIVWAGAVFLYGFFRARHQKIDFDIVHECGVFLVYCTAIFVFPILLEMNRTHDQREVIFIIRAVFILAATLIVLLMLFMRKLFLILKNRDTFDKVLRSVNIDYAQLSKVMPLAQRATNLVFMATYTPPGENASNKEESMKESNRRDSRSRSNKNRAQKRMKLALDLKQRNYAGVSMKQILGGNAAATNGGATRGKPIQVVAKVSKDLSSLWRELQVFETLSAGRVGSSGHLAEYIGLCSNFSSNVGGLQNQVQSGEEMALVSRFYPHGSMLQLCTQLTRDTTRSLNKIEHKIDPADWIHFLLDAALGLKELHDNKIIHRDLSLRNLVLGNDWKVKIIDFGLSQFVKSQRSVLDNPNDAVPWRISAPEQLHADRPSYSSTMTDVYQFGVLIWELFAFGRRPFEEINPQSEENLLFELQRRAYVEWNAKHAPSLSESSGDSDDDEYSQNSEREVAVTDPRGRVIQRVESNPRLFGPRKRGGGRRSSGSGSGGLIRGGGRSLRDITRHFNSRRKKTRQDVEMTPVDHLKFMARESNPELKEEYNGALAAGHEPRRGSNEMPHFELLRDPDLSELKHLMPGQLEPLLMFPDSSLCPPELVDLSKRCRSYIDEDRPPISEVVEKLQELVDSYEMEPSVDKKPPKHDRFLARFNKLRKNSSESLLPPSSDKDTKKDTRGRRSSKRSSSPRSTGGRSRSRGNSITSSASAPGTTSIGSGRPRSRSTPQNRHRRKPSLTIQNAALANAEAIQAAAMHSSGDNAALSSKHSTLRRPGARGDLASNSRSRGGRSTRSKGSPEYPPSSLDFHRQGSTKSFASSRKAASSYATDRHTLHRVDTLNTTGGETIDVSDMSTLGVYEPVSRPSSLRLHARQQPGMDMKQQPQQLQQQPMPVELPRQFASDLSFERSREVDEVSTHTDADARRSNPHAQLTSMPIDLGDAYGAKLSAMLSNYIHRISNGAIVLNEDASSTSFTQVLLNELQMHGHYTVKPNGFESKDSANDDSEDSINSDDGPTASASAALNTRGASSLADAAQRLAEDLSRVRIGFENQHDNGDDQARNSVSLKAISHELSMNYELFSLRVTPCPSAPTADDLAHQNESQFYVTYLSGVEEEEADDRLHSRTSSVTSEPDLGLAGRTKRASLSRSYALAELSAHGTSPGGHLPEKALRLATWSLGSDERWFAVQTEAHSQSVTLAPTPSHFGGTLVPPMSRGDSRRFSEPAALGNSNPGSQNGTQRFSTNNARRNTAFVDNTRNDGERVAILNATNSKYRLLGFTGALPAAHDSRHHHDDSDDVRKPVLRPSSRSHDPMFGRMESVDSDMGNGGIARSMSVADPAGAGGGYDAFHPSADSGRWRTPTLWQRRTSQKAQSNYQQQGLLDKNVAVDPYLATSSHIYGSSPRNSGNVTPVLSRGSRSHASTFNSQYAPSQYGNQYASLKQGSHSLPPGARLISHNKRESDGYRLPPPTRPQSHLRRHNGGFNGRNSMQQPLVPITTEERLDRAFDIQDRSAIAARELVQTAWRPQRQDPAVAARELVRAALTPAAEPLASPSRRTPTHRRTSAEARGFAFDNLGSPRSRHRASSSPRSANHSNVGGLMPGSVTPPVNRSVASSSVTKLHPDDAVANFSLDPKRPVTSPKRRKKRALENQGSLMSSREFDKVLLTSIVNDDGKEEASVERTSKAKGGKLTLKERVRAKLTKKDKAAAVASSSS